MTKQKTKTYYYVEQWIRERQFWSRFGKYDDIESAKKLAEHWNKLTGCTSRVVEVKVKEKTVERFISKKEESA